MKWLVKATRKTEDPYTHHISTSSKHYEYRTEKSARKKIQELTSASSYVTCELYQQIPGTFKQEQLFDNPFPGVWDF